MCVCEGGRFIVIIISYKWNVKLRGFLIYSSLLSDKDNIVGGPIDLVGKEQIAENENNESIIGRVIKMG